MIIKISVYERLSESLKDNMKVWNCNLSVNLWLQKHIHYIFGMSIQCWSLEPTEKVSVGVQLLYKLLFMCFGICDSPRSSCLNRSLLD